MTRNLGLLAMAFAAASAGLCRADAQSLGQLIDGIAAFNERRDKVAAPGDASGQGSVLCARLGSGGQIVDQRVLGPDVVEGCKFGKGGDSDARCAMLDGATGWSCSAAGTPAGAPEGAHACVRTGADGQIVDTRLIAPDVIEACRKSGNSGESDGRCAIVSGANGWSCRAPTRQ
ncbi:MAG: hypothetical protein HY059_09970 [Proteobacteria bacterium]|nr:hypothetical protein [Pseudomonadota bacterium]